MPVMSVRLDEEFSGKLKELAAREHKDQSTVARELIAQGWDYLMIQHYRDGRLSLGRLAEELGRPLGDVLDLLAGLGVPSPVEYDDYLEGFEALRVRKGARKK